ncbi:MAG: holo-ACP synthase [Nitrososphaerota archaeon]|nr:holo-ACP synthase [Nitrososphaerota archaeon]
MKPTQKRVPAKGDFDFPQHCNIGVDCEDIQRWREMVPKLGREPLKRLFSEDEHRYCQSLEDPAPHYAARWCAKEALVKALSPFCRVTMRDVEVARSADGRPFFIVTDPAVKKLGLEMRLSFSHSENTAIAMVLVFGGKKKRSK